MNRAKAKAPPSLLTETSEDFYRFFERVTPEWTAPRHLHKLVDALVRAEREPTRLVVNTPPQHGKSTTIFHWLARVLNQTRRRNVLYLTYSNSFAMAQMRIARKIAERANLSFAGDSRSYCSWYLNNGSTLYADGIDGSSTGRPGGIVVIDDPIKGWKEAQSRNIRDNVFNQLRSEILTRAHPNTSIVLVQTRWHEDDVSGRLVKQGWENVNLPAINADNEALWPEERPLDWLQEQRVQTGDYVFDALYQGNPRNIGGALFKGVNYYDRLPGNYRHGIGIDLAYSVKTKADYSVLVVVARDGGKLYVVDVQRKQVTAPEFFLTLKAKQTEYPGAKIMWHCSGTEKGTADWLKDRGVNVLTEVARADKFTRAQPVAALWNSGNLYVPREAPWLDTFLREVLEFTGVGDAHDDQVDALASSFEAVKYTASNEVDVVREKKTTGMKRWY